jgi:uncharacterized integral membrane protein (TIGR00698 family)
VTAPAADETGPRTIAARAATLLPGALLAAAVAGAAAGVEWLGAAVGAAPPAMAAAVVLGMVLAGVGSRDRIRPGLSWCVTSLLRAAVALLGLRIALGDILALGASTVAVVVLGMAAALAASVAVARRLGLGDGYGALAGAATAVCGASATLATASVLPSYPNRSADVAFSVVAANAVSTLAMLAYPAAAAALGLSATETGILLGGTIHDMAQVVGAGFSVSDASGGTAVVVKLLRVAMLLPVVLAIGWWFSSRAGAARDPAAPARVPVPVFAVGFLALAAANTALLETPAAPAYLVGRAALWEATDAMMLVAIAALGLTSSPAAWRGLGWRHAVGFLAATGAIFAAVAAGIWLAGRG